MLGAAPTKAAALITPLPLAAAALLVTGTFGLALASGSWGTGAATAIERKADSYDPKTGIRKTGQEVVFQLDQSSVAARPCVTKSQNHET